MTVVLCVLAAVILVSIVSLGHPVLVLMAAVLILGLYKAGKWAFWPRHELPRHRVRHLKLRLFFRLHPGRGFATVGELVKHWGAGASAKKDRYARP